MYSKNFKRFTLVCQLLCVFCCLLLLPLSLSGQSVSGSGTLPEWLKLPELPTTQQDSTKPLVLRLADSLESWGLWSIQVENWYQTLQATVSQTLILSEKREKALSDLIAAKDAEISLLRSIIKNQPGYIVGAGGGGLLAGFALGLWAGASIQK